MPTPDNGSNKNEEEFEISIPLKNFSYSDTISDVKEPKIPCFFSKTDNKKASRFFGRARENAKLLDCLQNAHKHSRDSFFVAGHRGVGKTRIVDEVLDDYKKDNSDFVEVRINLGRIVS
ncbi:MAG: ATP-binding protein [Nitrosomonas sp.]|nr:ATP-binding protein [Nitrosomonas sp.]